MTSISILNASVAGAGDVRRRRFPASERRRAYPHLPRLRGLEVRKQRLSLGIVRDVLERVAAADAITELLPCCAADNSGVRETRVNESNGERLGGAMCAMCAMCRTWHRKAQSGKRKCVFSASFPEKVKRNKEKHNNRPEAVAINKHNHHGRMT